MTKAKYLGIWMDHSNAHLMEFSEETISTKTLDSKFTHEQKIESLNRSEQLMHNKEQHEQHAYYKQLGEVIKNYEAVILFGPTQAKVELHNLLNADHHFDKIKFEVLSTDKMTENQQHAFVKTHFKNQYYKA